jgi:DNA gyrase/topoisomerase IV subunit B
MVRPPIGEVIHSETKDIEYAYTEAQFLALCGQHKTKSQQVTTLKYRGLAGIDSTILEYSSINPQTRKASVMRIKEAEMAIGMFGGCLRLLVEFAFDNPPAYCQPP